MDAYLKTVITPSANNVTSFYQKYFEHAQQVPKEIGLTDQFMLGVWLKDTKNEIKQFFPEQEQYTGDDLTWKIGTKTFSFQAKVTKAGQFYQGNRAIKYSCNILYTLSNGDFQWKILTGWDNPKAGIHACYLLFTHEGVKLLKAKDVVNICSTSHNSDEAMIQLSYKAVDFVEGIVALYNMAKE